MWAWRRRCGHGEEQVILHNKDWGVSSLEIRTENLVLVSIYWVVWLAYSVRSSVSSCIRRGLLGAERACMS